MTVEPTCFEPGEGIYTCEICGDSHTMVIDPLGHELVEVYTPPKPGVDGYWTFTCTRCDYSYVEVDKGSASGSSGNNIDTPTKPSEYDWLWYFFLF
jgi:transcription elongation factor Elf1